MNALRNILGSISARLRALVGMLARMVAPVVDQIAPRVSPAFEQMRGRYERFEPREKMLIQFAAVLLGVLLAYNFVYQPIIGFSAVIQAQIESRQRDMREIRRLTVMYSQAKANLADA